MLEQPKIDLAVLLKLFQHAEAGGKAETPQEVCHLFDIDLPLHRIELALETLEGRGEVKRVYHPHYSDEGLWKISRDGVRTVEKALKLPSSFIYRTSVGGDDWLEGEEAHAAKLNRNPRYDEHTIVEPPAPTTIRESTGLPPMSVNIAPVISPVFTNTMGGDENSVARSSAHAGWFGAWGTWVGALVAIAAIVAAYYLTK